jgi:hypothetical protein
MTDEVLRTYQVTDTIGRINRVEGTHFDVDHPNNRLWIHKGDEIVAVYQHWSSLIDLTTSEWSATDDR